MCPIQLPYKKLFTLALLTLSFNTQLVHSALFQRAIIALMFIKLNSDECYHNIKFSRTCFPLTREPHARKSHKRSNDTWFSNFNKLVLYKYELFLCYCIILWTIIQKRHVLVMKLRGVVQKFHAREIQSLLMLLSWQ